MCRHFSAKLLFTIASLFLKNPIENRNHLKFLLLKFSLIFNKKRCLILSSIKIKSLFYMLNFYEKKNHDLCKFAKKNA